MASRKCVFYAHRRAYEECAFPPRQGREAVESNSSDLVSLKDNVEAKRIPGYIVIKINGRFTFANYERIIAKLDKKLKNPVVEEELHVRNEIQFCSYPSDF